MSKKKIITLIIWCLLLPAALGAQQGKIAFEHITIKNGLSDGRIDCIIQDSQGFLWFGTQDGLNRYDGYNFIVFDYDIFDSTSISSNWIRCILEDRQGNLWIGTEGGGLNRFNRKDETFTRWIHNADDPASICDNFVRSILEDSFGNLWIGTLNGLVRFDPEQGVFSSLPVDSTDPDNPILNDNITDVYEDNEQNLWIGLTERAFYYNPRDHSLVQVPFDGEVGRVAVIYQDSFNTIWIGGRYNGLWRYDRELHKLVRPHYFNHDTQSLGSSEIKEIFEDKDRNLWIATMHGGLQLYDRKTGNVTSYKNDPRDPSSLSSNSVRTMYQDRTGVVWLGMDGSGIDSFVKNYPIFQLYGNGVGNPDGLSNNTILSIFEEEDANLWIGTEGGGLDRFDRQKRVIRHYKNEKQQPNSISSNQVTCIYKDQDGIFWIGTKEGLNRYDRENDLFHRYYVKTSPITGNNFINVITGDNDGRLLLGSNNGLIIFDKAIREFSHLDYDVDNILNNEAVVTILIDRERLWWIGYLRSGLVRYNPATGDYVHYRSDPGAVNSLNNNFVQSLYQDKSGQLWIATRKGLNRFNKTTGEFFSYTKTDGLPSNVIVGILEDNSGNLWLSTTNGLTKFNIGQENFNNYDISDGLQGNQFWINSCFKSQSGELFFGGNNGFNTFFPDDMTRFLNPHIPPIVISSVKISNRPIIHNFPANSSGADTLRLSWRENQISFEFAALDYTRPDKNQFAYMLQGFDTDWIYAGTRRYANYTNLDPGYYTFKVKGTNNDGVWNETGTVLSLFISTPFWKTWWALVLYGIIAAGFIYAVNAYFISLVRIRHDLKIERMEKEKAREINQFKLQFFTDVAHEFKTPLTLIQAPLEEIITSRKRGFQYEHEFRLMHRNVRYLLRLVHQLLDFRKAEQGKMELKTSHGNIVQFIREVYELFSDSALKHGIDYQFIAGSENIDGWFDWEKLEEILVNLIDNAFKYSPNHGKICVTVDTVSSPEDTCPNVVIGVKDSGIGIPAENLAHIFERFFHARDENHPNQVSSGLGLALSKRLTELHHGEITVTSEPGKGSCFTVRLPLGDRHLQADEKVTASNGSAFSLAAVKMPVDELITDEAPDSGATEKNTEEKPLILVVEDDNELRTYMIKTLARKYRIIDAGNGKDGLEKAQKHIPNIIISDIIMPQMDGIEMCRCLKSDLTTSHIPVILLTARSGIEQKIEGLETGADDYIEKPFHFRFLDARIKNILKSRQKLQQRYRQELLTQPTVIEAVSMDEKFLVKISELIEKRLADPDLEVKHLAIEVGISRTLLFVKLKELTGYSPKDFIKSIRLKKAAQYLQKTDLTIGEIAYQVGFIYPKYFSTCFLQQYGKTPSAFREQAREQVIS
ncbi:MAG TPA: two-component regulator propeller domain-containing protein [bacterium]|nr:two-component regulator propeller domain-containing protein [bacterium]HPN43535.1 two-component regulator propeller domain-containing protein [bacterium]